MKKILAALVILSLAGCVEVMSEAEVDTAVRECVERGGTPRFVPPRATNMAHYVQEVRCYGVQQ